MMYVSIMFRWLCRCSIMQWSVSQSVSQSSSFPSRTTTTNHLSYHNQPTNQPTNQLNLLHHSSGRKRTSPPRLQTNHRIQTPQTTLTIRSLPPPILIIPPPIPRRNLPPPRPLLQCNLQIHHGTSRRIQ